MRDTIKLQIGNREITSFLSYDVDSNVLVPADAFSVKLSRIDNSIQAGSNFKLYVNRKLEMTGVVDKVSNSYSKGSQEMTIEGRDYMGLLIDISVTEWKTVKNMGLKDLAAQLLKNVEYMKDSKIVCNINNSTSIDTCQPELGRSIFDVLSDYSQRQGLIMWMEPDGTLVFGKLKDSPDSESPEYSFYCYKGEKDKQKNNVISASNHSDLSRRYSKITTYAQIQGCDKRNVGDHTVTKTVSDNTFPFEKPLILQSNSSSEGGAAHQVEWEMKRRIADSWRLEYTVAGHSQNGNNYRANRVCYVKDEILGLAGTYLILDRRFTLDRTNGPRTSLTIGKLTEGYAVN